MPVKAESFTKSMEAAVNCSVPSGDAVIFGTGYQGGIWKSDGTAEGTMELSGVIVQDTVAATEFAGELYFSAADPDERHGAELWKTDGTRAGTVMVADIFPGPGGSRVSEMMVAGDTLFFVADDGRHGHEVWAIRREDEVSGDSTGTTGDAFDGRFGFL